MKTVCVIDGMGGGIGAEIIAHLRRKFQDEITILALGTNAGATERMLSAKASRGATGENAIKINAPAADFIIGPLGIAFPNALMGEITPAMAESISLSRGIKILIPVAQSHYYIPGLEERPLGELIALGIERIG